MGLPVFDPVLALALGVDQQGVSGGLGHNDTVLCGQLIVGQALQVPLSNLNDRDMILRQNSQMQDHLLNILISFNFFRNRG